jgi:predicted MFS family arabinose efflux permease
MGLAGGIIGTLYDLYLIRQLGMSPAIVGLTIGVGGVGAFVGAFLAGPLVARYGLGATICGAILVSSAASVLLPLAAGPLVVALPIILLAQISDVARTVFSINELSLRQTITPDQLLGRMNATFNQLPMAAGLIGTLAGGVLGQTLGLRSAIAIGVVGVLFASGWLFFSPIRRLRAVTPADAFQARGLVA